MEMFFVDSSFLKNEKSEEVAAKTDFEAFRE